MTNSSIAMIIPGLCRELKKHYCIKLRVNCDVDRIEEHSDYHIAVINHRKVRLCKSKVAGEPLVDEKMWLEAFEIAENIIPMLESIKPQNLR